jgi:enamine deaminase RidA (YjgF/YER057c/UK114 family)
MKSYNPKGVIDAEKLGYSHAVEAGGQLYVSGQVGWNENFETPDSFTEQVRGAFENIDTVLQGSGRGKEDITKVTAYIVDAAAHTDEFLEEWNQWRPGEPYPCLTILGVAGLAQDEFLVELEVEIAQKESGESTARDR